MNKGNLIITLLAALIKLNVSFEAAFNIINKTLDAAGLEEILDYEMSDYLTMIKLSPDGLYDVSHKELAEWSR